MILLIFEELYLPQFGPIKKWTAQIAEPAEVSIDAGFILPVAGLRADADN